MVNNTILISAAIVAVGLFICLFLIFRSKRKVNAIKHYEEIRDRLTLREIKVVKKKAQEEPISMMGSLQDFITGIVIVGVTLVIGIYITSEIGAQMASGSQEANLTKEVLQEFPLTNGAIQILPIIIILAIIIMSIGFIMRFIKTGDGGDKEKVQEALVGIEHYKRTRDNLTTR